jgi:hypothetical protein
VVKSDMEEGHYYLMAYHDESLLVRVTVKRSTDWASNGRTGLILILASNGCDFIQGRITEAAMTSTEPESIEEVFVKDFPLYISWHHTERFLQILKGGSQ